jgi:uncharacterized protein (UPF0548 family)
MFLLAKPSDEQIENIIAAQRGASLSYPFAGATREGARPAGYNVDHNRVRLGAGRDVFARAVDALRHWRMFDFDWMRLCWPTTPIEAGAQVVVLASMPGLWSVNACRIVYTIDDAGADARRFGFAYGTLPVHVARGEERFLVEWSAADDTVSYSIYALSRPKSLVAWAGYPVSRLMQRRFAGASKRAMVRAVAG